MSTCSVQSLMDSAACFACRTEEEKSTLELILLYAWSESTQTIQELMDSAQCFNCLTELDKSTLELQLLCEILNAEPIVVPMSLEFIDEIDSDGGYTGGVTVVVTGGTGPYTYLWTDDASIQSPQYTDVLSGVLGPSDWTIQVTDSLGEIVTEPWHVYRAAYEAELVEAADPFNFRPLDTEQTNSFQGIAKFDASLGTLLGVVFGYDNDVLNNTSFSSDPDIRTNNTSASTRSIRTEFAQVAEFIWDSTVLITINYSTSATNSILGSFFALPNCGSTYNFTAGEIPEDTSPATLAAVTGVGDITGLTLKSYVPTVNLVVTSGPASPDPTWAYVTTVPQPRPQIFGALSVKYRYLVPRS